MDKGTQIMLAILIAKLANSYYKRRLPGSWVLLRPTNNRITSVTMRPDISPMFLNFMIAQRSRIKPQAASTTTADIFCFCFFFFTKIFREVDFGFLFLNYFITHSGFLLKLKYIQWSTFLDFFGQTTRLVAAL